MYLCLYYINSFYINAVPTLCQIVSSTTWSCSSVYQVSHISFFGVWAHVTQPRPLKNNDWPGWPCIPGCSNQRPKPWPGHIDTPASQSIQIGADSNLAEFQTQPSEHWAKINSLCTLGTSIDHKWSQSYWVLMLINRIIVHSSTRDITQLSSMELPQHRGISSPKTSVTQGTPEVFEGQPPFHTGLVKSVSAR